MSLESRSWRVAIVIPALNESEAIASVVNGMLCYGTPIVVDDGSTDGTGEIARNAGATVVTHETNRGYDAALVSGLSKALSEGFDFAVTIDGDGQHNPSRIEGLLTQLVSGADLVVGIRDRLQRFSEFIFATLARLIWGIADPLCGMKGYRLDRLRTIDKLSTYRSIGTELTVRAARSVWTIVQVPVSTQERSGHSRFGSGLYANWLICRALCLGLLVARAHRLKAAG
jgi:glycosyltransferase involved in cell wall biosynthesis